jgi:pimeloyl-ACP methyl ester carboxylesterase
MGGAMSLYSLVHAGGARRVALISAPSSLKRELHRFAAKIGLSQRGTRAFIASVESHVGQPAADFDVRQVAGKIDLPVLLIHDQNDRQVPVVESARTAHALPGADLMVTRGLGHNRLLADPKVVNAVVDFVAQDTPAQEMRGNACTM